MRIDDLLRQQQRLADIMDPPALRLSRKVWETSRLFQAYENPLRQFRLQDPLTSLSREFNRTQQAVMDNVRKVTQPLETLSTATNQSLKNAKAELAARAVTAAGVTETARRSVKLSHSLGSFQLHTPRIGLHAHRVIDELFRHTQQLQKAASINFFPPHNLLAESVTVAARMAEATRRSVEFSASPIHFQQQLPRAVADSLRQTEQLQKALSLSFLPVTAFSSQLHDILQAKTSLAVLDPIFTGEMPPWLHDTGAMTLEPQREEFLAYLFGWLIEKFQQLLQGRISPEVFNTLNTLLTISFFLYSTWSNSQMENRLTEKLAAFASEKRIVRKIEEIRPNLTYRKRYVVAVTDRLRLRGEPSLEAPVLAFLLPNTLVEEIEQHESWSLVEFSDHADGSVKKGWVYRDYLQATQPES